VRGPSRIDVFYKISVFRWNNFEMELHFPFRWTVFLNNIYPSILIPDVLRFTAML
jgi:hypothetical protein